MKSEKHHPLLAADLLPQRAQLAAQGEALAQGLLETSSPEGPSVRGFVEGGRGSQTLDGVSKTFFDST